MVFITFLGFAVKQTSQRADMFEAGSHGATGHHLDVMSADAVVQTTVSTASTAPPSQGDGGLENGYSVVNESVQESLDSAGHDLPITAAEAMILPKTIVSTAFIAPSQVNGSLANGYPVFHDNVHEYLDSAAPVPEAPMSELPPLIQRFILSNSGTSEELLSNGQVKAPVLPNGANEELPSNCEELPSNGEIKAHVLTSTQVSNTEVSTKALCCDSSQQNTRCLTFSRSTSSLRRSQNRQ